MAVLGLHFCARAFSSFFGKRGPLFIAVHGPLTIAASLAAEHRLQTRRLSNCGSRAQLLRGMWDLPGPGLEPVSPALAGRFSTTAPPGKPKLLVLTGGQGHCAQQRICKLICYHFLVQYAIWPYILLFLTSSKFSYHCTFYQVTICSFHHALF